MGVGDERIPYACVHVHTCLNMINSLANGCPFGKFLGYAYDVIIHMCVCMHICMGVHVHGVPLPIHT